MKQLLLIICVAACSKPKAPEPVADTAGEIAGVHYLEHMTGGARADERVPLIIALHPMGGDPADLLQMLQRYPGRARLVLIYGHPHGGKYFWFDAFPPDAVTAPVITQEADRIASAMTALVASRSPVGKPIVLGYSQGAFMAYALAVTHPEEISAAFPISGVLAKSLSASLRSGARPPVIAFHGVDDLAVPTQSARESIAELQRAGYSAELHEYPGVAHDISEEELREILARIGRVAEQLTVSK